MADLQRSAIYRIYINSIAGKLISIRAYFLFELIILFT